MRENKIKINIVFTLTITLILSNLVSFSQNDKERKWSLNGYLKNMQSEMFQHIDSLWLSNNLVHNRLNFKWYPSDAFNLNIEVRNRFIYGDFVSYFPFYSQLTNKDAGAVDLTENIFSGKSYILNTSVDRLWIDYTWKKLQISAGRQRINWGQTFVWNPNDIFNAYSYFDFDYEEKPGSDAIRMQYYTTETSHAEIAAKINSHNYITAAFLYKFSKWNYDWQFLGGVLNENDYVAGAGLTGQLLKGSLRAEGTYFHPVENTADTSGDVVISVGYDYVFPNSSMAQIEVLYNSYGETDGTFNLTSFYFNDLSVKNLSMTRYSFFASYKYPVTPLINASLSGMYNPNDASFFIIPTLDFSLKDNLDLSLVAQSFQSRDNSSFGGSGTFVFVRLKGSF